MTTGQTRRAAIVGTGGRGRMYARKLAEHSDADVVALCDPNPIRMASYSHLITDLGRPEPRQYAPGDFEQMIKDNDIDTVVVTTVDRLHDAYIVPALDLGCRVITEKPMTIDADRAGRILDAAKRSDGQLMVTFNYRFNGAFDATYRALSEGRIGEILSVHFEWTLDTRHGADYFRRWHRQKDNSGGLMIHKASHHFDLVNWWLGAAPETVYAVGRLAFYGKENGARRGLARDYVRAHGAPEAVGDPFALDLGANEMNRELYLDAESADGYLRDQNVFGDGITIEDDMAVLVRYDSGASMSYHLTAYSPWEGYRVMFNGSEGRLELQVEESVWSSPPTPAPEEGLHGTAPARNAGGVSLRLRRLWEPPEELPVVHSHGGHGGADVRLLSALFDADPDPDDVARLATARDGALAMLIGAAANESFKTGQVVAIRDLLDVDS